ncbi:MAG: FAD-dependent oxidoreductase, partial [SAR324 cluster bacterium]|nr:FAD-dependent oxidoreductase [SAR324 cluster bacterium]
DGSENLRNFSFQDLIIASGARPKTIPGVPVDGLHIHTSRTILEHRKQPKDFLVIGAGAIGVEFAYLMHALGTKVTLVEMLDQILPVEDTEISRSLESILRKQGMIIKTSSAVSQLQVEEDRVRALITQGTSEEAWEGDSCLVAIGVVPNTDNIGLEEIGIELNRGFIKVDAFLRTNVPHYYAIGDVSGPPLLAHKASHEGIIAAEAACGVARHGMSYDNIPGCTYCQPQVASIGLTEAAAKEKGFRYKSAKVPFSAVGKAIATGETDGFLKVIIDAESGELLGMHILHAEATELISEAAVIRSHEGIAESVLNTIHPHPTISEATMEAMALALGRPINL